MLNKALQRRRWAFQRYPAWLRTLLALSRQREAQEFFTASNCFGKYKVWHSGLLPKTFLRTVARNLFACSFYFERRSRNSRALCDQSR